MTASRTYEDFGQTIAATGSSSNPYQFGATSGYRDDGDAGLLHVGARYYDPQVGRFITRDTYLDEHPYLYCEHDPVNQVDPDGHSPEEEAPKPKGKPLSHERGTGPNGEPGVWKEYKDGTRVFEPDPDPLGKKKGHDRGRNTKPRGGEEHSRRDKRWRPPGGGRAGFYLFLWDLSYKVYQKIFYRGIPEA